MSTIADKLIAAAQNEQRIYKKGYDKGVADAGGTVVTKPEVEGNYNITANGSYSYIPPADKVFSKVNVEVAVSGGTEDLNDVLTAQEEKLAELSAILDKKADDGSYDEGYADGRQAEYDAFWDAYQDYGNRTDYQYAFRGQYWTVDNFDPKYVPLVVTQGQEMFANTQYPSNDAVKSADFSRSTTLTQAFMAAKGFTELGIIDMRETSTWGRTNIFYNANNLQKIDKIILPSDGNIGTGTFTSCTSLKEVRFEGVLGVTMDLHWSTALSKASIESVINVLSDTTSGLSVTLSKTAVNSAFATTTGGAADGSTSAEWAALIATRSNWTISLV